MWSDFIHWLERHLLSCSWKKHFGIECPGCGMQRAFVELLKGNIVESLKLYPALLPTIFILVYLVLHIRFKYKNGAQVLKIAFIFTVVIIVVNYVIKVINHNI